MPISRAQMQKEVSTGSKKMKKKLKKVDKKKNPGLAKLPTKVRNKMGYMKKGGRVK
jgi:predicted RNA-binding protein with PIN domain